MPLGEELVKARTLLTQVEDLERRREVAEREWKQFSNSLEDGSARQRRQMFDIESQRVTVEYETRKKAMENDLAKDKLKALQDIRTAIQEQEQKYEKMLRLRATELAQVLTERLLPKLDEWIASPKDARIKMGTEIDSAVSQSMLKEASALRVGDAPPPPEQVEKRRKTTVRVSWAAGLLIVALLYFNWAHIYPLIEKLAGNSYAMKLIEQRHTDSIYEPPQTPEFRNSYTDNILYMKDY